MKNQRARSTYRGLRVTVTQLPDQEHALVNVSTKATNAHWDDWSLIFPAIRVPMEEIHDYRGVLQVIVNTTQALLQTERENR